MNKLKLLNHRSHTRKDKRQLHRLIGHPWGRQVSLWLIIMLFANSCLSAPADPANSRAPIIWTAPSLERIGMTAAPGTNSDIELWAARGEYEAFQVGIRSPQKTLTNVNFTVSDLTNANQQVIAKSNLTRYREHYIHLPRGSSPPPGSTNSPLGPGWYADALIPFEHPDTQADLKGAAFDAVPFNLAADQNQPIWVDIFVPRNAQPGDYTGTFTVTSDQGNSSGKIRLTVWNFELPVKPSLQSEFGFWEHKSKAAVVELLKHKLMPQADDIAPADERELIDRWGLTTLSLPFWSGANEATCKMAPAPPVTEFKAAAAQRQSDLRLSVRYADEIDNCPDLIKPMQQWARHIHQAGLTTAIAMTPTPALYDDGTGSGRSAVDIWIVLPEDYDAAPQRIAEVLKKGDQVWFYTALVQDGYSPKWQIDYAPINYRIPHGFINQSLGLTGVLYWRIDQWTKNPWHDVIAYAQGNEYYPGEGMLVYPGEPVGISGVVPSMRLKWLREGVEDYEYIEILKNRGRGDWALNQSRTVGANWQNWTRSPAELEAVRRQLGAAIADLPRP
jgi:Domain of unknown function (DUF4091)